MNSENHPLTARIVFRAKYEFEYQGLTGTMDAQVKRLEFNDDGSVTVVIAESRESVEAQLYRLLRRMLCKDERELSARVFAGFEKEAPTEDQFDACMLKALMTDCGKAGQS